MSAPLITTPDTIIQIKVSLSYFGQDETSFLIDFEEMDEDVLILINKTSSLLPFSPEKPVQEFDLEAYALRTGHYKLPDIHVNDFKSTYY